MEKEALEIVNSGRKLMKYLEAKGLYIDHVSGIDSSLNCIYLPDKTSFNWKSRSKCVRINCKYARKIVIEQKTGLSAIKNFKGDSTREWSFIIDNLVDLDKVIQSVL